MRLLILVTIIFLFLTGCSSHDGQKQILTLKDYPEVFREATIIIIAHESPPIVVESAEAIAADLKEATGNDVTIIDVADILEVDKAGNSLILVATPGSNDLHSELLTKSGISTITNEHPGAGKGVLEIATNPWDVDKAILLVGGSDQWGLKAAVLMLEAGHLRSISQAVVDWEECTEIEFPIDTEDEAIKYAKLDHDVKAYMERLSEMGYGLKTWAVLSSDSQVWAVGIEASGVEDVWMEIHFKPDGTIVSKAEGGI